MDAHATLAGLGDVRDVLLVLQLTKAVGRPGGEVVVGGRGLANRGELTLRGRPRNRDDDSPDSSEGGDAGSGDRGTRAHQREKYGSTTETCMTLSRQSEVAAALRIACGAGAS